MLRLFLFVLVSGAGLQLVMTPAAQMPNDRHQPLVEDLSKQRVGKQGIATSPPYTRVSPNAACSQSTPSLTGLTSVRTTVGGQAGPVMVGASAMGPLVGSTSTRDPRRSGSARGISTAFPTASVWQQGTADAPHGSGGLVSSGGLAKAKVLPSSMAGGMDMAGAWDNRNAQCGRGIVHSGRWSWTGDAVAPAERRRLALHAEHAAPHDASRLRGGQAEDGRGQDRQPPTSVAAQGAPFSECVTAGAAAYAGWMGVAGRDPESTSLDTSDAVPRAMRSAAACDSDFRALVAGATLPAALGGCGSWFMRTALPAQCMLTGGCRPRDGSADASLPKPQWRAARDGQVQGKPWVGAEGGLLHAKLAAAWQGHKRTQITDRQTEAAAGSQPLPHALPAVHRHRNGNNGLWDEVCGPVSHSIACADRPLCSARHWISLSKRRCAAPSVGSSRCHPSFLSALVVHRLMGLVTFLPLWSVG
jgi:hypothetical protein